MLRFQHTFSVYPPGGSGIPGDFTALKMKKPSPPFAITDSNASCVHDAWFSSEKFAAGTMVTFGALTGYPLESQSLLEQTNVPFP